jgi:hypothetical protein
MIGKPVAVVRRRLARWAAGVLVVAATWSSGSGLAQTATPASAPSSSGHVADRIPTDTSAPGGGSGLVQTGCSSCGGGCGSGLGTLCGPGELGSGGCGDCCYPGRNFCCSDCDCPTAIGRFFCGFYQCICCPDPCYDPCWLPVADTAFFLDQARPVTQMRLRYGADFGFKTPDRAEYFYARARTNPNQLEATGPCSLHGFGKGPNCIASEVDFEDLSLYMEAAKGAFSAFTEIPYRHIDPTTGPASVATNTRPATPAMMMPAPIANAVIPAGAGPLPTDVILGPGGAMVPATMAGTAPTMIPGGTRLARGTVLPPGTVVAPGATVPVAATPAATMPVAGPCCPVSGFADLIIGTKSMLLDCCLMQITFQFKTYLPTGNFIKGLGTAHVSLEPSILFNINLAKDTYLQGQFAYWIPVGGDDLYQGNIYHGHLALNRVLWRPCPSVCLVGTLEGSHWHIYNGAFTDPLLLASGTMANGMFTPGAGTDVAPISRSAHGDFIYAGPGVRLFICDKLDFGIGSQFVLTSDSFAQEQLRADFRWRF